MGISTSWNQVVPHRCRSCPRDRRHLPVHRAGNHHDGLPVGERQGAGILGVLGHSTSRSSYSPVDRVRIERSVSIQFQMGPIIGGLIVLGQTVKGGAAKALGPGIYVGFIIIMLIGLAAAAFQLPAQYIVRGDGTLGTSFVPARLSFEAILMN